MDFDAGTGGDAGAGAGDDGGAAAALLGGAASGDAGGDAGGEAGGASGGDGGAGAGAGDGAGTGAGSDPDWYDAVSADPLGEDKPSLRDWLKASGVKDVNQLAKLARDNQVALRENGRIKVPGEGASAEDVAAFRKAIGVPEDVSGYALPAIEDGDGNPVPLDDGLLGKLLPRALEHGVPAAAMNGLIADFVEMQLAEVRAHDAEQQAKASSWHKAQGEAATARLSAIDQAARALDLKSADIVAIGNVLGRDRAMEMFARLGEGMGEDVMSGGRVARFGSAGRGAQGELDAMKAQSRSDPAFATKVRTPGTPENAKWNRLNEAAAAWQAQQDRLAG